MLRRACRRLLCASAAAGDLNGLRVAVYLTNTNTAAADEAIALGTVMNQIAVDVYSISLSQISLSPVIEIGSRVFVTRREDQIGPMPFPEASPLRQQTGTRRHQRSPLQRLVDLLPK